MCINPCKCSFGMQMGKSLGFMLTKRGIEKNLDNFLAINDMRIPSNVKDVQQITGRLAVLSFFLSCASDKAFHFFATLKKKEKFEWKRECDGHSQT